MSFKIGDRVVIENNLHSRVGVITEIIPTLACSSGATVYGVSTEHCECVMRLAENADYARAGWNA